MRSAVGVGVCTVGTQSAIGRSDWGIWRTACRRAAITVHRPVLHGQQAVLCSPNTWPVDANTVLWPRCGSLSVTHSAFGKSVRETGTITKSSVPHLLEQAGGRRTAVQCTTLNGKAATFRLSYI